MASSSKSVFVDVHHRSFVSQSALSAVVKRIQEHGMPKTASRSSIKRTREAALPSNIFTTYQLQMNDGSTKSFPAVAPVDLLEYIVMTCMTFADFMKGLMDSTDTANWGIVIYTDEILPGAQLKINNNRKLVSFYWSFVQFGAKLGVEDCWLHLATIRRSWMTSAKCGWSQVFKELCKLFFKKPKDLASGVVLNLVGHGPCTLFAKIGAVIGDAPALQSVWGWKGATGWKCCFFCQNVVLEASELAQYDATGRLVSHCETDVSKLALQTDNALMQSAASLVANLHLPKGRFADMEKALGINYLREGALFDQGLQEFLSGGPIAITQYDIMHVFYVSGVWNTECGLVLKVLKEESLLSYKEAHEQLQNWTFPKHFGSRSVTGSKCLVKHVDGEVRCSASEGLSIYGVFRSVFMSIDTSNSIMAQRAVQSYHSLCRVLDMLKELNTANPDTLQRAICDHLTRRLIAHGRTEMQPKCHFSLHIPMFLKGHTRVMSCWVHERKHRELKRYGTQSANSNMANTAYEAGLLRDVVLAQCKRMQEMHFGSVVELVSPTPCDQRTQQAIHGILNAQIVTDILLAKEAVLNCALHVHAGDVVLQKVGEQELIGEVYFHCKVMNEFWTCLSLWRHITGNKYRVQDAPCLVATQSIHRCLTYKVAQADAEVSP